MGFVETVLATQADFSTVFAEVIESWFSADIACCDSCYNSFVGTWPAIYERDKDFQSSGMPLDAIYDGSSALCELYTEKEFLERAAELSCPRCGNTFIGNVWPYELPFEPPSDFENIVSDIQLISRKTPSLVLTNKYARKHLLKSGSYQNM